ncbi:hypothetical protein GGS26DRAFT_29624 [Hypomontagnella submonticulosa]|nr:hypothetical protein GGS26DRAFT_29624 [Hypomontagnella submonticulosa]
MASPAYLTPTNLRRSTNDDNNNNNNNNFENNAQSTQDKGNDDFQSNVQSSQDSFNRATTAITTGWIVGIVLIVVSAIVAMALLVWMYRRNAKRRRERMAQFNPEPKTDWPPNGSQNLGTGLQSPSQPPTVWNPSGYGQHNELGGQAVPSRYEAPNDPAPPREIPNNEVAPKHHQPLCEADSTPRSELPV